MSCKSQKGVLASTHLTVFHKTTKHRTQGCLEPDLQVHTSHPRSEAEARFPSTSRDGQAHMNWNGAELTSAVRGSPETPSSGVPPFQTCQQRRSGSFRMQRYPNQYQPLSQSNSSSTS